MCCAPSGVRNFLVEFNNKKQRKTPSAAYPELKEMSALALLHVPKTAINSNKFGVSFLFRSTFAPMHILLVLLQIICMLKNKRRTLEAFLVYVGQMLLQII
jgi:hypothetical protein